MASTPFRVFYSYSHADIRMLEKLRKHMAMLRRQGLITEWYDREIEAGSDWRQEIERELEAADVILLLVSADFLASDFCYEQEMTRAVERAQRGEALLIGVLLHPADWNGSPFAGFQLVPRDARPISKWSDMDEAYADVVGRIRATLEGRARSAADGPPGGGDPAPAFDLAVDEGAALTPPSAAPSPIAPASDEAATMQHSEQKAALDSARSLEWGGQRSEAEAEYQRLAEEGYVDATFALHLGLRNREEAYDQALYWLYIAAKQIDLITPGLLPAAMSDALQKDSSLDLKAPPWSDDDPDDDVESLADAYVDLGLTFIDAGRKEEGERLIEEAAEMGWTPAVEHLRELRSGDGPARP